MTSAARALPYEVRQVKAGWWLRFSGTLDPETGDVDWTPVWAEVASVEVLDPDPNNRSVIRRRITYTDGRREDWMATATVIALRPDEARAAGLISRTPSQ